MAGGGVVVTFLGLGVLCGAVCGYFPRACVYITDSQLPPASGQDRALFGHVYGAVEVAGVFWCARRCLQQNKCLSFNYVEGSRRCELSSAAAGQHPAALLPAPGVLYYERYTIPSHFIGACAGHDCHPEAVCQPLDATNFTCECQQPDAQGPNCTQVVADACASSPCKGGATCVTTDDGFMCACAPGYMGPKCQLVACPILDERASPGYYSPEVEVTWRNRAGAHVDMFWVHADGRERYAFTVPAAAQRHAPAMMDYVFVARDRETKLLLPVNESCSFLVPRDAENVVQVDILAR